MRKYWKEILLALVLGLALPWAVAAAGMKSPVPATEITATETMETTAAHMEATDRTLKVLQEGQVTEMDLDEYLTGVLLGEIPADFEPETKKAQAVVARTYALRCAGGPTASIRRQTSAPMRPAVRATAPRRTILPPAGLRKQSTVPQRP